MCVTFGGKGSTKSDVLDFLQKFEQGSKNKFNLDVRLSECQAAAFYLVAKKAKVINWNGHIVTRYLVSLNFFFQINFDKKKLIQSAEVDKDRFENALKTFEVSSMCNLIHTHD